MNHNSPARAVFYSVIFWSQEARGRVTGHTVAGRRDMMVSLRS